jgi:hypothetical protein
LDFKLKDINVAVKVIDAELLVTFYSHLTISQTFPPELKRKVKKSKRPNDNWQYEYYKQTKCIIS